MTSRSDQGRALAALRHRATLTCVVCGQSFEAWARKTQPARTCSPKCRVKLHRQEHKKQESPMPKTSKWNAQHIGCQAAVDAVRRELTAEIERLRSENEAAIREVEQSTQRWASLTSTRQTDKADVERLTNILARILIAAVDDDPE
jgi:chromosome segregation ATPase